MREINLDASEWTSILDFYYALLPTLAAPKWHSMSVDALIDSMIWGGMNGVEPPYVVRIHGTKNLPEDIVSELRLTAHYLAEARKEFQAQEGHDVEVSMEIVDGSGAEGRDGDTASTPIVMTKPPLSRDESEAMYGLPKRPKPRGNYSYVLRFIRTGHGDGKPSLLLSADKKDTPIASDHTADKGGSVSRIQSYGVSIEIDARNWRSMADFCADLLPALQAPDWHSCSYDGLIETMIWRDDVNGVKPPYAVRVSHLASAPKAVQEGVIQLRDGLVNARRDFNAQNGRDVDVYMEIVD